MSEKPSPDVVRWYTRARKFPQLIGRTPDGAKLWGGPYTITQAVGAGMTLFVGLNTMSLWAGFGFVGNLLVLGGVTYGVVLGLGRIPVGSRSPLSVAAGAYKAIASPAHGRLGGKPVRLRRPHRVRHAVVLRLEHPGLDPVAVQDLSSAITATTSTAAVVDVDQGPARSRESGQRTRGRHFPHLHFPHLHLPRRRTAPTATAPAAAPRPAAASTSPAAPPVNKPALTGVQSLLAGAGQLPRSEAS